MSVLAAGTQIIFAGVRIKQPGSTTRPSSFAVYVTFACGSRTV